jgi:hypothetical protein
MTRPAVGVKAEIMEENGRWVVYLDLTFWREAESGEDLNPLENVRRRIRDYPTKRDAEVAAHWMERTADRANPIRNLRFL